MFRLFLDDLLDYLSATWPRSLAIIWWRRIIALPMLHSVWIVSSFPWAIFLPFKSVGSLVQFIIIINLSILILLQDFKHLLLTHIGWSFLQLLILKEKLLLLLLHLLIQLLQAALELINVHVFLMVEACSTWWLELACAATEWLSISGSSMWWWRMVCCTSANLKRSADLALGVDWDIDIVWEAICWFTETSMQILLS